jgi:hypothetical protein
MLTTSCLSFCLHAHNAEDKTRRLWGHSHRHNHGVSLIAMPKENKSELRERRQNGEQEGTCAAGVRD